MDAITVLKTRRSVRKYQDRPVEKRVIEDIVDCGHLAASGRNVQPCRFVAVMEKGMKEKIADICEYGKFIRDAAACVVVLAEESKYMLEDGSAAAQNILLAAKAYGLGSCWVCGHGKEYAADIERLLGVPETVKLIACIAIGYADGEASTQKKTLEEVLHWDRW